MADSAWNFIKHGTLKKKSKILPKKIFGNEKLPTVLPKKEKQKKKRGPPLHLPHSFVQALPAENLNEIPSTRKKLRWSRVSNFEII
jgi:hypothetical protein